MSPRPKLKSPLSALANLRLTQDERVEAEYTAYQLGFSSISAYFRHLHREQVRKLADRPHPDYSGSAPLQVYHRTELGTVFQGDATSLLHQTLEPASVDLIMTSPPFGLVRKKSYGNEDADEYVEWFRPFAEGFRRVLKPAGSLVIDIGGAWKPGIPIRSLYHFELLIALCRDFGFFLAQEHYWWNPSKLPTPAEWVNVRRVRVKDAVNSVYWLSLTPWPKASNRRVLQPYSESMLTLLTKGYRAKKRPSGHDISTKFSTNNGASIPPNLLNIPNTESNSAYLRYCQAHGIDAHPARFPSALPEYFIRMLTDRGDLVVDPFAGSCVTGEVCERLDRRWMCTELIEDYLKGALGRFSGDAKRATRKDINKAVLDKNNYYRAPRPDILWDGIPADTLPLDGGQSRPKRKARIDGKGSTELAAGG